MSILGHRLTSLAVAAAIAFAAGDALAFSHGSWGGSSASYGSSSSGSYSSGSSSSGSYSSGSSSSGSYSSYGSSSSGSYSSGSYSSGSSSSASYGGYSRPGLFARWHAKKAARASSSSASYGSSSSSASYGTYYSSSSGSSSSGSSSSGASYGGAYYSTPVESAPMDMTAPADGSMGVPTEATPAMPDAPGVPAATDGASIRVMVPADATVFVNDTLTASTGVERNYVSRGLRMGMTYAYAIRVEYQKDGKQAVENKMVSLRPGQTVSLAFGDGSTPVDGAKTELTLHVPAEAKVTLAGAETKQTGEVRTYATTTLADGQKWDGYVVRVELMRDGKPVVEEKTLSIIGGKNYDLSFEFPAEGAKVATLN